MDPGIVLNQKFEHFSVLPKDRQGARHHDEGHDESLKAKKDVEEEDIDDNRENEKVGHRD